MRIKVFISVLTFFVCSSVFAQEQTQPQVPATAQSAQVRPAQPVQGQAKSRYAVEIGTITEISTEDQQIIVEYNEPPKTIHRGDRLVIAIEGGSQCSIIVTDIANTIATASIESCPNIEFVTAGDQVTKSRITRAMRKPGYNSKFKAQGFAALLSYSFTTTTSLTGTAAGFAATESDNLGGAIGLNAEYYMFQEQSVGFTAGLTFEFPRTDTGGTATVGNTSLNLNYTTQSQYTLILPNANLNYMFNQYLYVLGGLNYSILSVTNTQGASYNGQLGYQVGVGSMFDQHVGAELQYRWLNFTGTGIPSLNINGINFNGFLLRVGYYF